MTLRAHRPISFASAFRHPVPLPLPPPLSASPNHADYLSSVNVLGLYRRARKHPVGGSLRVSCRVSVRILNQGHRLVQGSTKPRTVLGMQEVHSGSKRVEETRGRQRRWGAIDFSRQRMFGCTEPEYWTVTRVLTQTFGLLCDFVQCALDGRDTPMAAVNVRINFGKLGINV